METVYKYLIPITNVFTLSLPKAALILSFQVQFEQPCVWALVNPDEPTELRSFRLAGTGHAIEERGRYIGSAQMMGGGLVWHLFETTPINITIGGPVYDIKAAP